MCIVKDSHTGQEADQVPWCSFSSSKFSPLSSPPSITAYISHEKGYVKLLFLLLHWNAYWDHRDFRFAKSSDQFSLLSLLCFLAALDSFLRAFFPRLKQAHPFPSSLAAFPSPLLDLPSLPDLHASQCPSLAFFPSFLLISYRACIHSFVCLFVCLLGYRACGILVPRQRLNSSLLQWKLNHWSSGS